MTARDEKASSSSCCWKSAIQQETGRTYYFHSETKETQWEKPLALATETERREIQEKERQQKDFFAAMEANILRTMAMTAINSSSNNSNGHLQQPQQSKQKQKQQPGASTTTTTTATSTASTAATTTTTTTSATPTIPKPIPFNQSSRKRPKLVRTISTMDDTVLKSLVQRVPSAVTTTTTTTTKKSFRRKSWLSRSRFSLKSSSSKRGNGMNETNETTTSRFGFGRRGSSSDDGMKYNDETTTTTTETTQTTTTSSGRFGFSSSKKKKKKHVDNNHNGIQETMSSPGGRFRLKSSSISRRGSNDGCGETSHHTPEHTMMTEAAASGRSGFSRRGSNECKYNAAAAAATVEASRFGFRRRRSIERKKDSNNNVTLQEEYRMMLESTEEEDDDEHSIELDFGSARGAPQKTTTTSPPSRYEFRRVNSNERNKDKNNNIRPPGAALVPPESTSDEDDISLDLNNNNNKDTNAGLNEYILFEPDDDDDSESEEHTTPSTSPTTELSNNMCRRRRRRRHLERAESLILDDLEKITNQMANATIVMEEEGEISMSDGLDFLSSNHMASSDLNFSMAVALNDEIGFFDPNDLESDDDKEDESNDQHDDDDDDDDTEKRPQRESSSPRQSLADVAAEVRSTFKQSILPIAPDDDEEEEEEVLKKKPELKRRNSCGTLFVKSTMADPDTDATIKCVCGVYRAHVITSDQDDCGRYDPIQDRYRKFNDRESERFSTPRLEEEIAVGHISLEEEEELKAEVPTLEEVCNFYRDVFRRAQIGAQCIIMSLVYVERLIKTTEGALRPRKSNWRSLLFSCMVLSSKVWNDAGRWNVEFSRTCPAGVVFSVKRVNELEIAALTALNFKVKVTASEYAKYYFLLRGMLIKSGLCEREDLRNMMPLDLEGAKQLELVSSIFQKSSENKRKARYADALRSKSMGDAERAQLLKGAQRAHHLASLEQMVQL